MPVRPIRSLLKLVCLGSAFLDLAGCASQPPRYYLQLQPLSSRIERDTQEDSIRPTAQVRAQYLGEHRGALEISVKIRNGSGSGLQIDPGRFVAQVGWGDSLVAGQGLDPAPILDRLVLIQEANLSLARIESAQNPYRTTAGADAVFGMLDASLGLASALSGKESEKDRQDREQRVRDSEQKRRDGAAFETNRSVALTGLASELDYLQRKVWEPVLLKEGEEMERSILIRSPQDATLLVLDLPLGKSRHRFVFRQAKVRLN
jgi:hypothetical protein